MSKQLLVLCALLVTGGSGFTLPRPHAPTMHLFHTESSSDVTKSHHVSESHVKLQLNVCTGSKCKGASLSKIREASVQWGETVEIR
ncbi:hypothetical protein TrLO_g16018 [Triparma laevis f. longispina]|uniref:Uncharacterized protein n=1 Tax=Triparma laevis f. longispina TaxID=1714387 RepID=A0A9W7C4T9_9STRA|nr:hypothetical protein TrLO_g16018 [Triparma laevis f. longispina]